MLRREAHRASAVIDKLDELIEAYNSSELNAVAKAKRIVKLRKRMFHVFGDSLFVDPAMDILMGVFIAQAEGAQISIKEACIYSNVPDTTALRWIFALVNKGLLVRTADETDKRRSFVRLTDEGQQKMEASLRNDDMPLGGDPASV